jgi:uncharacterized protein YecE (DUF72 family)
MRLLTGTSGFAYKEWKGTFYPAELRDREMLRFYSTRFASVEINNTFYKMPAESMLLGWTEQVPADFTFVLKASQRITHMRRLKDAAEPLTWMLRSAAVLGHRLGPILFQLPPNMKKDVDRLDGFLRLLPQGLRAAFEFRHDSWLDDEIFDTLRNHNAALCVADSTEIATPLVPTTDWGYLRLRRESYDDSAIRDWAAALDAQPWNVAFVFFKHEDAGAGPRLARHFQAAFDRLGPA